MKFVILTLLIIAQMAFAQEDLDCSSLGYQAGDKIKTLEDTTGVDCLILQHYVQSQYRALDPLADMALMCLAHNYPKRIIWAFQKKTSDNDPAVKEFYEKAALGEKCAKLAFDEKQNKELHYITTLKEWGDMEEDLAVIADMDLTDRSREIIIDLLVNGNLNQEGKGKPLDAKGFIHMMNQVIKEQSDMGLNPVINTQLDWSPEFIKFIGKKFPIFRKRSKLLMALATGEAIRFMMTGKEDDLYLYMMTREEASIYPHELFRESYRLNQGDVYLSILTIQNLLSQHWLKPNRGKIDYITKLKPITHHLGQNEDVFGTWYHLFGSIVYGYAKGELRARFITMFESALSLAYGGKDGDIQENRINQQGSVIGARLKRSLKKSEWKKIEDIRIDPKSYLKKGTFKKIVVE